MLGLMPAGVQVGLERRPDHNVIVTAEHFLRDDQGQRVSPDGEIIDGIVGLLELEPIVGIDVDPEHGAAFQAADNTFNEAAIWSQRTLPSSTPTQ